MSNKWFKIGTFAALAVLAALAGLVAFSLTAFAQGPATGAAAAGEYGLAGRRGGAWGGPQGSLVAAAAQVLGMDQAALVAELNGQSIAAVAQAHSVAPEKIADAFVAPRAEALKQAVAAGRLTQAQADAQLAAMKANALAQLNAPFAPRGAGTGTGFTDADGDGVCDLCTSGAQPMTGRQGPRWNR
jgi:type V secretory pathway adhesin AidA